MAVTYSQNGTIVRQIAPTTVAVGRRIDSEQGINVVDENGYIGAVVTDYFPHSGNTYYNNFAVVVNNADFSQSGLGQVAFITPGTTDIGGRTYRTVNIGGVEWLAENLDYKFSGCAIDGSGEWITPAAWYYNSNEADYGIDGTYKCGLLYNWYAAKFLNDNRATLCPGWHVPTNAEFESLSTAVGGSTDAGTKLKCQNGSILTNYPTNWNGTDDYNFSAPPCGFRDRGGGFYDATKSIGFWSVDIYETEYSYLYTMTYNRTSAYIETIRGSRGYSLRLVRDAT